MMAIVFPYNFSVDASKRLGDAMGAPPFLIRLAVGEKNVSLCSRSEGGHVRCSY